MRATILLAALALAAPALAADVPPGLQGCWLEGVELEAWCGQVQRPLDPSRAGGVQIAVHFAVLPAVARNKKVDPVFFFAGGPGQSAIELAGQASRILARFSNRRDIVLIDQRGTGRSAPLRCEDDDKPGRPLRDAADPERQIAELHECRVRLGALPYGDLRQFTTTIAMQDADAVRQRLGAAQINLVGGSYGTRAALEYRRQFPQAVRRVVLDGAAPPDMVLPAASSTDTQASFDALVTSCEGDGACRAQYPALRAQWHALLASLPRTVRVSHPLTGAAEQVTVTRDMLASLVRLPLYSPALASALPVAITQAAQGRFDALLGLSTGLGGGRGLALYQGMHFSVVCAEDVSRLDESDTAPGADFGDSFARLYRRVCADWPRGEVPPDFYRLPPSTAAVLVLSGGIDPATPPRHGARVAQALGPQARHVVVANAGHGLMAIDCLRDVIFRFVDAATDAQALQLDTGCAQNIPRPTAFVPVAPEAGR